MAAVRSMLLLIRSDGETTHGVFHILSECEHRGVTPKREVLKCSSEVSQNSPCVTGSHDRGYCHPTQPVKGCCSTFLLSLLSTAQQWEISEYQVHLYVIYTMRMRMLHVKQL